MGDNGIFNIVGPTEEGTKAQFTDQSTAVWVTVDTTIGKITGVKVLLHDNLVDPSAYELNPPLIGEVYSPNTQITVTAKKNSSYTGSAKVSINQVYANPAQIKAAVSAQLLGKTETNKVTVYIDPSVTLLDGTALINPTYTINKVFGTMMVGSQKYNLVFTQDTTDKSGYTWYVVPGPDATEDPTKPTNWI